MSGQSFVGTLWLSLDELLWYPSRFSSKLKSVNEQKKKKKKSWPVEELSGNAAGILCLCHSRGSALPFARGKILGQNIPRMLLVCLSPTCLCSSQHILDAAFPNPDKVMQALVNENLISTKHSWLVLHSNLDCLCYFALLMQFVLGVKGGKKTTGK